MLIKTVVWYSISNGGDGSAYPHWWLTEEEAEWEQENMDEGWGESCTGSVETYVGSDIYLEGLESRKEAQKEFLINTKQLVFADYSEQYGYKLSEEDEEKAGMLFLEQSLLDYSEDDEDY